MKLDEDIIISTFYDNYLVAHQTVKARIKIEYIESERFERTNDSVKYMLGLLELTTDQVDEMWRYAITL